VRVGRKCNVNTVGPLQDTTNRKDEEDFLMYGFTAASVNVEGRPKCVIRCEELANESYLAEMFTKIRELHLSFQSTTTTIISAHEKLNPYEE
jgi:hypothetical protein